jgi:hypothetical protein
VGDDQAVKAAMAKAENSEAPVDTSDTAPGAHREEPPSIAPTPAPSATNTPAALAPAVSPPEAL